MTETFDAAAKALEIEHLAKTNLDSQHSDTHQIENSVIEGESDRNLRLQFTELKKNPEQLLAVGKELEKLASESFSTLPNVSIATKDGEVESITFNRSYFDLQCCPWAQEKIDLGKPQEK